MILGTQSNSDATRGSWCGIKHCVMLLWHLAWHAAWRHVKLGLKLAWQARSNGCCLVRTKSSSLKRVEFFLNFKFFFKFSFFLPFILNILGITVIMALLFSFFFFLFFFFLFFFFGIIWFYNKLSRKKKISFERHFIE
jgi:hypothetical protein